MKQHLKLILLNKVNNLQLGLALLGTMLGLSIVMLGVQVYVDVKRLMEQKDMLGGDYLVINKRINLLNSLSGGPSRFSDAEIAEIEKIPGISRVGKFVPGRFRAKMAMPEGLGNFSAPGLQTDMFFEAVPAEFVDIPASEWDWDSHSENVPIIIPADYLKIYNMAFAQSQGLPVVPEGIIKTIRFDIQLQGKGRSETRKGRIAGFSERINTVLVPQAFLEYSNSLYASERAADPARLVLLAKDPSSPELLQFFRGHGYELNEEKLKASRINTILQLIVGMVAGLGLLITALALLGFIQYNQLLAYRSAYEIQTLSWIGYSNRSIARPYYNFTLRSVGLTFLIACGVLLLSRWYLGRLLSSKGFEIEFSGIWYAVGSGCIIAVLMIMLGTWSSLKQIKTLAR